MKPIEECIAGRISPEVAIARLLLEGADADTILAATGSDHPAIITVHALVTDRRHALDALAAQIAVDRLSGRLAGEQLCPSTSDECIANVAAFFDHAVRHSAEASVALYSLGDPTILQTATAEIVDWLEAQGLLRAGSDVLDLGCGIGRIAAAIAPRCRSVLALDVSSAMVAEAKGRLVGMSNVEVLHTNGRGIDALSVASFDLVLAVDSFPYIVQAGGDLALHHVRGATRALRPGGAFCVLNLSYRGNDAADRADLAAWSADTGMRPLHWGGRPFRLWDGAAFVLTR
jgi:ubiquinone/menaquinone biosynthesis C-methylase UbiE